MTLREKFFLHIEDGQALGLLVMRQRNKDYSRVDDPFRNFRVSAAASRISAERALLQLITTKVARLENLISNGFENASPDDHFEDTCIDLSNYGQIMRVLRLMRDELPGLETVEGDASGAEWPKDPIARAMVEALEDENSLMSLDPVTGEVRYVEEETATEPAWKERLLALVGKKKDAA